MLKFITKKYPCGYTVWLKTEFGKKQVANKLKTIEDVHLFLDKKAIEIIK